MVTAAGRRERTFRLVLAESAQESIEVSPGEPVAAGGAEGGSSGQAPEAETSSPGLGPRKLLALGTGAVGVAGLTVGMIAGLTGTSSHSSLESKCQQPSGNCPSAAQGDIDAFHSARDWSTAGYVIGAAGIVGGVVLWLTAPRSPARSGTASERTVRAVVGWPGGNVLMRRCAAVLPTLLALLLVMSGCPQFLSDEYHVVVDPTDGAEPTWQPDATGADGASGEGGEGMDLP